MNTLTETNYLLADPANKAHLLESIAQLNVSKSVSKRLLLQREEFNHFDLSIPFTLAQALLTFAEYAKDNFIGNFAKEEAPTQVKFVKPNYPDGQREILAVFKDKEWASKGKCLCYAHVGQHSECHKSFWNRVEAKKEEYLYLYKELIGLGYNLKIVNKDCNQNLDLTLLKAPFNRFLETRSYLYNLHRGGYAVRQAYLSYAKEELVYLELRVVVEKEGKIRVDLASNSKEYRNNLDWNLLFKKEFTFEEFAGLELEEFFSGLVEVVNRLEV